MHIVNVICILFRNAYVMYMSSLLLLSVYVHVIYILSGHICIMCTLSAVVLDMFLPNRQCLCHSYIISSTFYISYHIQLSFCTLSTQTYIVNAIWMLSTHVHIICLSSLTLLIYPIIHILIFTHCLHTHTHCLCHLYIVYKCIYYVHLISTAVIYICTCHLHIIWEYMFYMHIMCSGPWHVPS